MVSFGKRISFAFRAFFSILGDGLIDDEVLKELGYTPGRTTNKEESGATAPRQAPETPKAESVDRAVQMLALLQRDGRLVDFLSENVSQYPDAQLGAAVRMIHENCKQVLDRYVRLEPIINSEEDQPATVQPGFDPAAIKLIGNVTGAPPVRGMLRHRGWRVKDVSLPSLPEGTGRSVIAPAEVEIP